MKLIPVAKPLIDSVEADLVQQCIKSSWVSSSGKFIGEFESKFAQLTSVKHGISCCNGTAALHLSLLASNIGPGDEVIVPALTFIATANAVRYVGATVTLVDVTPDTWTIDPDKIEERISPRTKAIIPVHLYGYPADMSPILRLAKKYKLMVIEDAAEAHEALYKGKKVGSIGHIGCFSFFGNKILTTGEGGMITTNRTYLKLKLELLKNHGMSKTKKYFHPVLGYNYRMTNIQAAIGVAQIKKIADIMKKRRHLSKRYATLLKKIPGLEFQKNYPDRESVCWLFSFLVTPQYGRTRNQLIVHLKKRGIDSRPFFYPLTSFPMYRSKRQFFVSERLAIQGINIPSFPEISDTEIDYIVSEIKKFSCS